ncbi:hypothetical protein CDL15_Pgr024168 [Punica granatum]|uniref:Uncharacterized protein n=1 Tax=Punica granatum TaxID=22663 RepID=A0A218XX68_PUNGR|nr:hypothetical protein CDL15_Pgr024168 [Punica granatum]
MKTCPSHPLSSPIIFFLSPISAPFFFLPSTIEVHERTIFLLSTSVHLLPSTQPSAVYVFEFEDGVNARLLSKCGHSFHIEPVVQLPEAKSELTASISVSDPDPSSGLCADSKPNRSSGIHVHLQCLGSKPNRSNEASIEALLM